MAVGRVQEEEWLKEINMEAISNLDYRKNSPQLFNIVIVPKRVFGMFYL